MSTVKSKFNNNLENIYLFKVNSRNSGEICEIWSKLTTKTPEWHQQRFFGVFFDNFELISPPFLVFSLLILSSLNVCQIYSFSTLSLLSFCCYYTEKISSFSYNKVMEKNVNRQKFIETMVMMIILYWQSYFQYMS